MRSACTARADLGASPQIGDGEPINACLGSAREAALIKMRCRFVDPMQPWPRGFRGPPVQFFRKVLCRLAECRSLEMLKLAEPAILIQN